MSTRGAFGFVIDGVEKIGYNHLSSEFDVLGEHLVRQIRAADLQKWRNQARSLVIVDQNSTPTAEQIEALREFSNLTVGGGNEQDWYSLIRELQGDMQKTLDVGYMIDSRSSLSNSLFCEYAYILNFDTWKFEVYKGWQRSKHDKGRYGQSKLVGGYGGVALVGEFVPDFIPEDWIAQINM